VRGGLRGGVFVVVIVVTVAATVTVTVLMVFMMVMVVTRVVVGAMIRMIVIPLVVIVPVPGAAQQFDTLGERDHRRLAARCLDETIKKPFQVQAIGQNYVGFAHGNRVGRLGFIGMGVPIGRNQGGKGDPFTAHIPGEIADDGKRGDDLQLRGMGWRPHA